MEQIEPSFDTGLDGHRLLGSGSAATGGVGWSGNAFLSYRCARCGAVMRADRSEDFACDCGAMTYHAGTRKFGSTLGDHNIMVYQVDFDVGEIDFDAL